MFCFFDILFQLIAAPDSLNISGAHCFELGIIAQALAVILIACFQVCISLYLPVNDFKMQPESFIQYFQLFIDIRLCILQISVFVNEIIESIYRPVSYSYRIFGLLFGIFHALPHIIDRVDSLVEAFPELVYLVAQLCRSCLRLIDVDNVFAYPYSKGRDQEPDPNCGNRRHSSTQRF